MILSEKSERAKSDKPGHALASLMQPRSVAVIGASAREGATGNNAIRNLLDRRFGGAIYPINPGASDICGLRTYPDLKSLPQVPDCAVVAIPAEKIIATLGEAAELGVRSAVIFASGFGEAGGDGALREHDLRALASRTGLAVCGPNCLGLANIGGGIPLYSTLLPEHIRPGGVAVVSHSGSGGILLSNVARFGFSYVITAGNSTVLDIADYLDFLADDPATRVAALFLESIRDPVRFAAAARKMHTAGKPVIALKVGRSKKGAAATAAHTGSLAGAGAAYDEFFRLHGVISVDDFDELVESVALMQSLRHLPRGRGLGVVNVSGGEIALTCDMAQALGIELPELSAGATTRLKAALPSFGHAINPVDATGTAVLDLNMYRACIEALASDPGIAVVAVSQDAPADLGPRQAARYGKLAATAAQAAATIDKPLVFYSNLAAGIHPLIAKPLEEGGVPALQGARASLLAIRRLIDYSKNSIGPAVVAPPSRRDEKWGARLATRAPFTEREAKALLAAHGIPVTREAFAASPDEAAAAATRLGFPVALKVESADIAHKSEAGGVRLNLHDTGQVRGAFDDVVAAARKHAPKARIEGVLVQEMVRDGIELIVGISRQAPFGMALTLGFGGVLVELVRDSALTLLPVDRASVSELIGRTKAAAMLKGFRGAPPADVAALIDVVLALSNVATAYRDEIEVLELNPVSVLPAGSGVRVLDALLIPH